MNSDSTIWPEIDPAHKPPSAIQLGRIEEAARLNSTLHLLLLFQWCLQPGIDTLERFVEDPETCRGLDNMYLTIHAYLGTEEWE